MSSLIADAVSLELEYMLGAMLREDSKINIMYPLTGIQWRDFKELVRNLAA